jgi:alanyl aminopeptidase
MVRKATTGLTWEWIRNNDKVVIEMIPESFRSNIVPALGSSFCSMDKAEVWEAFVNAHAEMIPGYERNLDQASETIRLCAALKSARSADLLAALSKQ